MSRAPVFVLDGLSDGLLVALLTCNHASPSELKTDCRMVIFWLNYKLFSQKFCKRQRNSVENKMASTIE